MRQHVHRIETNPRGDQVTALRIGELPLSLDLVYDLLRKVEDHALQVDFVKLSCPVVAQQVRKSDERTGRIEDIVEKDVFQRLSALFMADILYCEQRKHVVFPVEGRG